MSSSSIENLFTLLNDISWRKTKQTNVVWNKDVKELMQTIELKDISIIERKTSSIDKLFSKTCIWKNPSFDVWVMYWSSGYQSATHDHAAGGCLMKVMSGKLLENRFLDYKEDSTTTTQQQILNTNTISFICNEEAVHNVSCIEDAISLHVYCHLDEKNPSA